MKHELVINENAVEWVLKNEGHAMVREISHIVYPIDERLDIMQFQSDGWALVAKYSFSEPILAFGECTDIVNFARQRDIPLDNV